MTATQTPPTAIRPAERDSFASTLRAEWTKFRTVRGWMIGMIVAGILTVLVGLLAAGGVNIGCGSPGAPAKSGKACLPHIAERLAAGRLKIADVVECVPVVEIAEEDVARYRDPRVVFMNVNKPDELERARALPQELR